MIEIGAGRNHFHSFALGWASGLPDGFFFRPKVPIWVYFGGPWNGKCFKYLVTHM
jgi:hypothetical protein